MGKRVATAEFIEESSPVKKYATFDYTVEKKEDEVTTSEDFSSDEDEESKEQPEVVSKNVSVGATDKSSGSSERNSEEDKKEMEVVITPKMPRNGSGDVLEKKLGSSKSSGSEYSSPEKEQPELVSKNISVGTADSSGSSESESEEDAEKEMEVVITPKMPENASRNGSGDVLEKKLGTSKSSGSEYSSSDEELEEQLEVVSKNVSVGATYRSSGSSESESEEDVEKKTDVAITPKMPETASRNGFGDVLEKKLGSRKSYGSEYSSSDEDESKEQQPKVVSKNVSIGATNRSSGSSESDSEEDVEKEMEVVVAPKMPQTASRNGSGDVLEKKLGSGKSSGSEYSSSDEDKDNTQEIVDLKKEQGDDIPDESDEEEVQRKKLKVRVDNAEEMVDAESPKTNSKAAIESSSKIATKTPTTPQAQKTGSKKLFVGNLSFSLEQEDLEEFFKDAGEIVNVHFATHRDGRFRGHAIVEFATEEAVQKALEKNGQDLMGKSVNLGLPHSKSSFTPQTGYADKSGGAGCGWKSNARGGRSGSSGGRFSSRGRSCSRGGRFRGGGRGCF